MKKRHVFAPLGLSVLLLGACTGNAEKEKEPEEQTEQEEPAVVDKTDTVKSNEELKDSLSKEGGVSDVSLIITEDAGGYVLLDFEVDADMKEDQAKKIAKKFQERIAKEYPEHSIDIQARKSGETFVQETKEAK